MKKKSGPFLKEFLREKKIPVASAARASGMSRVAFYKYFAGRGISRPVAMKISDGLWRHYNVRIEPEILID